MLFPFWKKWLSYLHPITLERLSSPKNPQLAVVLDRGRLQLLSGNAIYSWDDLYHNFTIAFGQLNVERRSIADVLVLGLGLGSVPFILEKVYKCTCSYTAVEWDEAVVHLASKYTLPRLQSRVDIVVADAGHFVQVTKARFDLIAVDIFEDDHTPAPFESADFLRACRRRLRPGGLLLYNRLYNSDANRQASQAFYRDTFCRVFEHARAIETNGNLILVGEAE
ncbi:MAG: methyltransferase domain-containing protein [Saprospiraceae bacterium]|nr:methyltransferase domain-containing protein [Saprospiraceae bacterium]MDW8228232.1 methyltransferase domain-containing protein [Saprospiraceae bacterium]